MTETTPSPPPPAAPLQEPPPPSAPKADGSKFYNEVTDKIGGPSLRLGDNIASLVGGIVGAIAGGIFGYIVGAATSSPWWGLVIGGILGMSVGVILVGFVLMIVGLARK